MEFPRYIHKYNNTPKPDVKLVVGLDEYEEAIKLGWCGTILEAMQPKAEAPKLEPEPIVVAVEMPNDDDTRPPSREELETKALELGVPFDRRVSDKTLGERIAKKLGE